MNILGLNAYHGDASAALFRGGQLVAAIEEERLNRIKHWAGFPARAIASCLQDAGIGEVEHVAVSRDPRAHFWRKALRAVCRPGSWRRIAGRARNSARFLQLRAELAAAGLGRAADVPLYFVEHHRAHLASAFFASPFEEAAVVSVDGFGDFSSVMWGVGRGNSFRVLGSVQFPHSLGIFYTAFTQFLGFPKYGDEYKMMGLAAYGEPRFREQVRHVVETRGGRARLNLDYFTHHTQGVDMTWQGSEPVLGPVFSGKMAEVFGPPRAPRSEVQPRDADLAASVQAVLEENYFALLNHVAAHTGERNLCLAGGVALNCAANGRLFEQTPFRDLFIQPAAHDAGTSIGAALYVQHQVLGQPRSFEMRHVYYGPAYREEQIRSAIEAAGAVARCLSEDQLVDRTARELAAGKIIGWFQGRMEFGPRALGNRSILADPRRPEMRDILNCRIKHREPFRPFCPSVLAEAAADIFETACPAPFMVTAYRIRPEWHSELPAVTHADGTGRLQTVDRDANPLYWKLIKRFEQLTGVPVLINTSFNENEPVVNTPRQALECFLRTDMDLLVLGPFVLEKSENLRAAQGSHAFFAETRGI